MRTMSRAYTLRDRLVVVEVDTDVEGLDLRHGRNLGVHERFHLYMDVL